jgi:transcriptional regulator with XRE-family HTH domain/DNA polymerase III delta prime subunit
MRMKPTGQHYATDPDNIELLELMSCLDGHGLTQREVASLLEISPGQLSRVKKGERHASRKHVRTLREHLRRLTIDRKVQEIKSAPNPLAVSVFRIDAAVLNRLSPSAAIETFRDLLWARAAELGVTTTRVSISSDVFTTDGGVDASILEGQGPTIDGDELLTSGTRYQIKTGDFRLWQQAKAREELFGRKKAAKFQNLGAAIQRTLREKKRLVFVCFGIDPVDEKLRKARENLVDAFEACGYPAAQVEVWGVTQLLGLFQRYPAVCLRLRGHDHQGFRSWQSWSTDADMNSPVQYSPEFRQQIDELREELQSGRVPHLRLVGEPGVGKTRLALELTRAANLSPATLYIRDGRSLLQSTFLNELLQPEDQRFAILVIDECPPKDRADVWNLLRPRSNRLRLVTIDHGPEMAADEKMRLFLVQPISEAQIKSIIAEYGINDHDSHRWAAYCQGCPRVAHVVGENLRQNRPDMLQTPATVNVWERFIVGTDPPDSEDVQLRRIVLRHIALFERFGFEPPVDQEARFIAAMARECDPRLTWPRFQAVIVWLKERRIVQGTTTLYITPRLLHVHVNREFWENHGSGFDIAKVWQEMPEQLWSWFVAMLRYAHTSPAASKAVDQLLGPKGIFPGSSFPDQEHYGQMLMRLTETNPRPALRCLQRTIGKTTAVQLRELCQARQYIVWSLGLLAVWEECFAASAELLLRLAEAENATHCNNATGTFVELFSLVPGMAATQAAASTRISCLRAMLDSNSSARRALALRAAESALSTRGSGRTVGPEHQGLRQTIEFWFPKTYGELWDAYREVWQIIVEKLSEWTGEERGALIRSLIRAAKWVFDISVITPCVLQTLESLSNDPQVDVKELLSFIRRELRYRKEHLSEQSICRLAAIDKKLEGSDFPSKLRRYVKYATTDDSFDKNHNRTNVLEQKLYELAQEGMAARNLLLVELRWLVSESSSAAYCLAYQLGKLDTKQDLLPVVTGIQQGLGEDASPTFFSGYLRSIHDSDPRNWESLMLSLADTPVIQKQLPDLVIGSGMSDIVASKIVELCKCGVTNPNRLGRIRFSQRLQQIGESIFLQLIDVQLAGSEADLWSNAVHMFHAYYLGIGAERPVPEQETFQLLTWPTWDGESGESSVNYCWSELAASFVKRYPSRTWEFFTAILRLGTKRWNVLIDLDMTQEQVLTRLFRSDPERAWQCVAEVYSVTGKGSSFGIQHWLSDGGHRLYGDDAPGPIQFVPPGTLFAWVDQNVEDHAYWLIPALPKTMDASLGGRLSREFVARYGANKEFSNSLWCRFHSGSWCGPASNHYRVLRNQAHEWLAGERNPTVIRWIEDYIDQLSASIEQAEIEEERRM